MRRETRGRQRAVPLWEECHMKLRRVCTVYFSPTGGTERLARALSGELAALFGLEEAFFPLTLPSGRGEPLSFGPQDLVVAASPVYAGRLPNKLAPVFAGLLHGEGAPSVALCAFGNRSPGDALREWLLLLEAGGFVPVAAASLACRHAFCDAIGAGRPDAEDFAALRDFARSAAPSLAGPAPRPLAFDRETPIAPYYTPLRTDGAPAKFLKAKPVRLAGCTRCGLCAGLCPMGGIDGATLEVTGVCIKCQACVRGCPAHALRFEDADFLSHVAMLRERFTGRAENAFLL